MRTTRGSKNSFPASGKEAHPISPRKRYACSSKRIAAGTGIVVPMRTRWVKKALRRQALLIERTTPSVRFAWNASCPRAASLECSISATTSSASNASAHGVQRTISARPSITSGRVQSVDRLATSSFHHISMQRVRLRNRFARSTGTRLARSPAACLTKVVANVPSRTVAITRTSTNRVTSSSTATLKIKSSTQRASGSTTTSLLWPNAWA